MARPFRRFVWNEVAQAAYLQERGLLRIERKLLRDSQDPFHVREEDFIKFFRVNKDIARYLCASLGNGLRKRRSSGLSVEVQVLVTLRFLAEGSYQRGVGQDFLLSVSQTSVSRCVTKVTQGICDELQKWITFPSLNEEMDDIQERFRPSAGFPGVVGAIDCTHIAIVTPLENAEGYRNRKGFYSLNAQMICDDKMVIRNVTIYPGSVHDQFIWNYCRPKDVMRAANGAYFLLGDSGYALEPWLLTPLPHALEGTPEYNYSMAHCRTRSRVERVFGVLKARWRCLLKDRVLHYSPTKASTIIVCCAILHNIMTHHGYPLPDIPVEQEIPQEEEHEAGNQLIVARRIQQSIIRRYFA